MTSYCYCKNSNTNGYKKEESPEELLTGGVEPADWTVDGSSYE